MPTFDHFKVMVMFRFLGIRNQPELLVPRDLLGPWYISNDKCQIIRLGGLEKLGDSLLGGIDRITKVEDVHRLFPDHPI